MAHPGHQLHYVEIEDHHYVGPEGIPQKHVTVETFVALARSAYYIYSPIKGTRVEVNEGGGVPEPQESSSEEPYQHFRIPLDSPLAVGQEGRLQHTSYFNYKERPAPLFCRQTPEIPANLVSLPPEVIAQLGLRRLLTVVRFDPKKQPRTVWRAEWDDCHTTNVVISEKKVPLQSSEAGPYVAQELENPPPGRSFGFHWQF